MAKRAGPVNRGGGAKRAGRGPSRAPRAAAADTTGKALVIVESPAKARTINRYLGDEYVVRASMGHVRDLPQREFGVDLADNFRPTYVSVEGRAALLGQLRKMAGQARAVYLATDLDREGEAIAWHLAEALAIPAGKARRVIFNQITRQAVQEAFGQPHAIDMDKVNAQQARRILDRIVGYQVSPLLSRKIRRGLSAGRVQSVAVRLIVEREREIRAFVPEEYWEIAVELSPDSAEAADRAGRELAELLAKADPNKGLSRQELYAFCRERRLLLTELVEFDGVKFRPNNESDALAAAEGLRRASYRIAAIKTTQRQDRPPGPFTTAALQQAAVNQLGLRAAETMRLAQQLYEGVELEGEGSVGLITYMRTDSMNLAPEAVNAARAFISQTFGPSFVPESPNRYASASGAQEAHEAIRPTDVARTPESLRGKLDRRLWRLYDLIWRRFVACQMAPARWEVVSVDVQATCPPSPNHPSPNHPSRDRKGAVNALLRASGRRLLFEGYLKVAERREAPEPVLPDGLTGGQPVWPARVEPSQHFTEPPPRYTEASLVRTMEAESIGRPSTYAATIETIQQRGYVELKDRKFAPTALGEVVTDQLVAAFPHIFDVEFTRFMEAELDKIEEAHADWVVILREFYGPFSECLSRAAETFARPVEPSPHACPKCGRNLVYRVGKAGRFLGCSGYPACDYTANVNDKGEPVELVRKDVACPECGKPMMLRASRRGTFLGCTGYPECTGTMPCDEQGNPLKLVQPEEVKADCPDCGQPMQVRFARGRAFLGCSGYPRCGATAPIPAGLAVRRPPAKTIPTGIACEKCGKPMVVRSSRRGPFLSCSGYPACRNARNLTAEERSAVKAGETIGPVEAGAGEPARPRPGPGKPARTRAGSGKPARTRPGSPPEQSPAPAPGGPPPARPAAAPDASSPQAAALTGELGELARTPCPNCGSPLALRSSRFGPFLGCSKYPACKTVVKLKGDALEQARAALGLPGRATRESRPKPKPTDIPCAQCGAPMVIRDGPTGKFLGCSKYPRCRNTAPLPVELTNGNVQ